jgi:cytochrome c oxidase assembly factor 5
LGGEQAADGGVEGDGALVTGDAGGVTASAMASSCQGLIKALKECLLNSDCVVKDGNLPSDCLRNHANDLPTQCQFLRTATMECKRGMVS